MELARPHGQDGFMTIEDGESPRKPPIFTAPALDLLGVAELEAYIITLEHEILRVRKAIAQKNAHRDAAAAFFRAPPVE
jgi:uncharacterized small protein (DUF1192 family)